MKLFLLIAFAFLAPFCEAGTGDPGTINSIYYMANGTVLFRSTGAHSNRPSCASAYDGWWSIETNSSAGKARLAGLLTAYSAGTKIQIVGQGTCAYWGDREAVDYFFTVE